MTVLMVVEIVVVVMTRLIAIEMMSKRLRKIMLTKFFLGARPLFVGS